MNHDKKKITLAIAMIIIVAAAVIILLYVMNFARTNPSKIQNAAPKAAKATQTNETAQTATNAESSQALNRVIEKTYIDGRIAKGQKWSVYAQKLSGDKTMIDINGDCRMQSASCIKLFIAATVYGRHFYPADGTQRIAFSGTSDNTVRNLINTMISQSDNTAANTLVRYLGRGNARQGLSAVNDWCKQNGYRQTSMGRLFLEKNPKSDNYTSAKDLSNLLASIKENDCVNYQASSEMLEALKSQQRTNKIPAGIKASGKKKTVANKTGEIALGQGTGCIENDAAVVFDAQNNAYTLVVLSNDLNGDNASAQENIANIAKIIAQRWA